ncbi:hypothetical protein [Polaribacter atrinae]|uniref:hypothetical protein n=1 Tax=Polaribacter atrinae TaxID=1333662 RepID=UPI0024932D8A|nr:hypothetical protein [Polaribacter atrinae]
MIIVAPPLSPRIVIFFDTLIDFSSRYSPVFKFKTDPGEALSIAFLKVSKPGSTVVSSAFIIGATIAGVHPGLN